MIRTIQANGPIGMVAIAKEWNDRGIRTARAAELDALADAVL
jgi:hypothetical protein